MKRLAPLICLLLTITNIVLSKERYVYTQVAQKEGLTSTVNCIYKEKDGNVWIGTPNGLYSFNGYTLRNHSAHLLGSHKVFHINCDKDGNLWVLTDKHVLKRTADSDAFVRVSSTEATYHNMLPDATGIWISGVKGLYRYNCSDQTFSLFCPISDGFDCRFMGSIDENSLLCCSHNGKVLVDLTSKDVAEAPFGNRKEVSATLVDKEGRIWLAFYNNGIEVFEKDGRKIKSYNTGNSPLSCNLVLCLTQRDSLILAGTDGGGINIINPKNDNIDVLSHVSGDPSSFPAHSIKSLHVDHYGSIWAGSIRDGLINISRSEIKFYSDTHIGLSNGLSNPTVLCLHQGRSSDHIWIGTDGEGINRFNPSTYEFTHYGSSLKTKVVSIADYSPTELALSTFADNLWIFNKHSGKIRQMPISNPDLTSWIRYSGRSINLYNENDGDLLLFANLIYRYDKTTGQFAPVRLNDGKKSYSNFLIIGRSDEGIWLHNRQNIYLLEDDANELIHKGYHKNGEIRSGHLGQDGTIWLATEEGLCRFDTETGTFKHIRTTIFSNATSVICDSHARVWVGTEMGLSAYITETESFAMFGDSDGVMQNEYLPKPHLLANNGDIYLGGVQGLLHIGKNHKIQKTEEPELRLENVSVDGIRQDIPWTSLFKTPRDCQTMEIGLSIGERDMFRHRVFRFYLSDQVYETHIPLLSLQQMPPPGKYEISVSCTKRNGEWTEPTKLMTIRILQPWYLSWWFIGGSLILLLLIYLTAIYSINRQKSNELKIAIKEQEQKVYEEKVKMLINISHELRTPLTLIMAPLKRLLKDKNPEVEDFSTLNRIYRQSRRMKGIIDTVLDLRKMEVGGGELKLKKTDFNNWLSETVQDIVDEEKTSEIEIVIEQGIDIGMVEYDTQKCETVLINILMNAIKHSSAGDRITIRTELTADGMIRTSISDQGPGLGKDVDLSRLFTRFYQSKNEHYGSGIGLSYSKILVEMHGGHIGVFNNPDKGATFWWEIPSESTVISTQGAHAYLNELLGDSSEADTPVSTRDDFNTLSMKLMLVDDNQDLLDFLRESLCQDFAEIITVTGGNGALKEITGGKLPDIIVSDVNMPDGDGYTLCRTLKESDKYSHIPVVLLTARGEEQSQSDSYRLGADAFMAKPFEIETLMELLRNLLRNKAEIRKRYLDNDSVADADYGSNEERFILQLNTIISEHLSDPTLDQQLICREMGVSRALLYNKMKAITGAGTKEYIIKIRIEKAKSLIENSSLTIAEISDMTGFASQSYFSTAFKNYTGMTPSQFKQKCR